MDKNFTYPEAKAMLKVLALSTFRPFTKMDWYSFAGCETANPVICETDEYTIVIDGDNVNMVYHEDEYGGRLYSLSDLG